MDQEELEIQIGPDGRVTVRTIGIKGPRCIDIAEAIALIVGREKSRTLTAEYHETDLRTSSHQEQHLWR